MVTNIRHKMTLTTLNEKKERTPNSTYKKLAVQYLNEVLCFVSSFVVADSLVLRNRQLRVAANRCTQAKFWTCFKKNFKFEM